MLTLIVSRFRRIQVFLPQIWSIVVIGAELRSVLLQDSVKCNHALFVSLCRNSFGAASSLFGSRALLSISVLLAKDSVNHVFLLEE